MKRLSAGERLAVAAIVLGLAVPALATILLAPQSLIGGP